jgi:hypothetical protein
MFDKNTCKAVRRPLLSHHTAPNLLPHVIQEPHPGRKDLFMIECFECPVLELSSFFEYSSLGWQRTRSYHMLHARDLAERRYLTKVLYILIAF